MPKKPKLTKEEKARRRAQRGADRKNAKLREELPLFADHLPQHTAASEARRVQRQAAQAAANPHGFITQGERHGVNLWKELQLYHIRRVARELLGEQAVAILDAKCRGTYPSSDYWHDFWRRVLTGARIEIEWERVVNRQPGQPALVCITWWPPEGWEPPFTREQFDQRFPFAAPPPATHDDDGLAAQVDAELDRWGLSQGK